MLSTRKALQILLKKPKPVKRKRKGKKYTMKTLIKRKLLCPYYIKGNSGTKNITRYKEYHCDDIEFKPSRGHKHSKSCSNNRASKYIEQADKRRNA